MKRQGDVLLVPVTIQSNDLKDVAPDPRGLVLAEGETSGHFHGVFGRAARLCHFRDTNQKVLVIDKEDAEVRVVGGEVNGKPRHFPITLTPGTYEVRLQQTLTSEHASRQISD